MNKTFNLKGLKNAIDRIFEVRQDLKRAKSEDTELGTSIKDLMLAQRLDQVEGTRAQANISRRPVYKIDPEAYYEALGGDLDKFMASVIVRMDDDPKTGRAGAKSFLGKNIIEEISDVEEIPVLNIKKLTKSKNTKTNIA